MFIKNIKLNAGEMKTIDFLNGIEIGNHELKGTFRFFELIYTSCDMCWLHPNRKEPIAVPGEDNSIPVGAMGLIKVIPLERVRQLDNLALGTLQILAIEEGWLTIMIWLTESEFKDQTKRIS